ncbi:MAG: WD40 repeat domain-containing protein [Armatimonadota bacterium]
MRRRDLLLGLPLLAGGRLAAAPAAPITGLTFSPDGRFLLCSGYGEILVRSVPELRVVRRLPCGLPQIHALAFHPDGKALAAAGGTPGASGSAHLFSWPAGKRIGELGASRDLATSLAFNPDGARLAVSGSDRAARVWAMPGPGAPVPSKPLLTLAGHAGPVLAIAYTADGSLLVTGSADRSLRVWDAGTGGLRRTLTNHTEIVHCLAARPQSAESGPHPYCVSGGDDRTARVWQPGLGRMVRIVRGHAGPVLAVLYSRDGKQLFSAGAEGVVRVIDAESDQVLRSWSPTREWIYRLALSPDGRRLAAGDWRGRVFLWEWEAGR